MKVRCLGCMEEYEEGLSACPHCGYVNGTPAGEVHYISPGSVLAGRYMVGKVLGSGGFGITYIGYDSLLCKKVAIKEYFPVEFATRMLNQTKMAIYGGDKKEQFQVGMRKTLDEAKRLAQLGDVPGIAHVFDFFEENNTAYIVMEYLDGETLKSRLDRQGKMTVEEALPIILSVLDSLKAVHKHGIIHRDIAPDNIFLLKTGEVKLLDFGASRYATSGHSKSLTVLVKFGYAPVEQYQSNGNQGPWTDVYSLAATFYRMITGKKPEEATERRLKDTLKEPSKLGVSIKKSTENALMNALNVKIEDRTKSAEEFEKALLSSEVSKVKATADDRDAGRWPIWLKAVIFLAVIAVVAAGVMVAVNLRQIGPDQAASVELGENEARIPNLINMDQDQAREIVTEAGFEFAIGRSESSDLIREGRILGVEIDGKPVNAGRVEEKGKTLSVTISTGRGSAKIPDLIWMNQTAAVQALKELRLLSVNIVDDEETWAAEGVVTGVEPEIGETVPLDQIITLKVAKGEADASKEAGQVPNLTGMSQQEAYEALKGAGLYMEKVSMEYSDEIPAGSVIAQSQGEMETVVSVTVSLGKEQLLVENYQNMTIQDAQAELEAAGFVVELQEEASDTVEEGMVIRQSIAPGTMTDKGASIILTISTGAQQTQAPTQAPRTERAPAGGRGQSTPNDGVQSGG